MGNTYWSNCVVSAVLAWLMNPSNVKIRLVPNRHGRWHCVWEDERGTHEFYAPGRSSRPYWANMICAAIGWAMENG